MTADMASLARGSISSSSSASTSGDVADAPRSYSPDASDAGRNKVVGACSSCRRSKVRCEHDGTAPCKRCKNGGYECAFKPREMGSAFLHDEWRVRTDETLTKLVSAINALVQQESSSSWRKRKAADDGWRDESAIASPAAGPLHARAAGPTHAMTLNESMLGYRVQPHLANLSTSATPMDHGGITASRRPSAVYGLNPLAHRPGAILSGTDAIVGRDAAKGSPRAQNSLALPHFALCSPAPTTAARKTALLSRHSRYRYPDASLGSNDPRLDAVRLGIISSHEARSLFSLYAKRIEPFAFGFPDFPASSELTPVLLSAIATVASRHSHADLRERQLRLRADVLDRTLPYAPTTAEDEFNPESGIGTEEVVGACIWSAYDASPDAWRVARAARWWSEKYSYESGPHAGLTVGEMVAILPPVRPVNMQDRVRVWLAAFLAELHQCEIHDRQPIMQLVDPSQYGQALTSDLHASSTRSTSPGGLGMTKQDAALVFYCRVAFLITKSRGVGDAEELLKLSREITGCWYEARAKLATDPDRKDECDHTIDLHHALAKARTLVMACRAYETRCTGAATPEQASAATASPISCAQQCQSACMDVLRLLVAPRAGLVGSLAVLPLIYHHWITGCLVFLLQLCEPDGQFYRLGLLAAGQLEDVLRTVDGFVQQYVGELAQCTSSVPIEGQDEQHAHESVHHPALEPALAIAELLAGVRATA